MIFNKKIILAIIICLSVFVGVTIYSCNQIYGAELSREEQLNLPSHFHSVEDLEEFLAEDDTDRHLYLEAENGIIKLTDNCEDYALQLQQRALEQDCILNVQIEDNHAINNAKIDNEWWYICPQTDRTWLWGYLD